MIRRRIGRSSVVTLRFIVKCLPINLIGICQFHTTIDILKAVVDILSLVIKSPIAKKVQN